MLFHFLGVSFKLLFQYCPFFQFRLFISLGILHPHLTNYLARICERYGGAVIGNQIFGNKLSIEESLIGYQFFGRATLGNEPNMP
jgi:hypothetical protein